jgi:hypothetical protein
MLRLLNAMQCKMEIVIQECNIFIWCQKVVFCNHLSNWEFKNPYLGNLLIPSTHPIPSIIWTKQASTHSSWVKTHSKEPQAFLYISPTCSFCWWRLCNIFFYLVNYETIWKSQLWHIFSILIFVQMKQIKTYSCSLFKDLVNKINIFCKCSNEL